MEHTVTLKSLAVREGSIIQTDMKVLLDNPDDTSSVQVSRVMWVLCWIETLTDWVLSLQLYIKARAGAVARRRGHFVKK